ncbi:MAG: hypothetical protein Q7V17_13770 [Afipia sp.]|nr:hypothetical protein [Afipia sp.]
MQLFKIVPLIVIGGVVGWYFVSRNPAFNAAGIKEVEQSIRNEYAKNADLTLTEINLLKESDRKLVGFVKVRVKGLSDPVMKSCSATLADDGSQYLWQCQ